MTAPADTPAAGRRAPLLTAATWLAMTSAVVVTLIVRFNESFMVNDDVIMAAMASGDYTGRPTAHLVFVGALASAPVALAYRVWPGAPWYGLALFAIQIAAWAAIAGVAWRRRRQLGRVALCALATATLLFVPILVLSVTFTATSILAGLAGVVLLCARPTVTATFLSRNTIAGIVALGVAAAVRWDGFLGVVVVFAPAGLVALWRLGRRGATLTAGGLAICAVVVLGSNFALAHQGGWSTFERYNDTRSQLHGTSSLTTALHHPDRTEFARMLRDNDWTVADIELFSSWFFDDPVAYSRANLDRLLHVVRSTSSRSSIGEAWHAVVDYRGWAVVLVGICAVAGSITRRPRVFVLAIVQCGWAGAVFIATASTQRFPDRLAYPMFFALAVALCICPALVDPAPGRLRSLGANVRSWRAADAVQLIVVGSAVTVAVAPAHPYLALDAVSEWNGNRRLAYSWQRSALDRVDRDGRFVVVGDALAIDAVSPLEDVRPFEDRILTLGWPISSPTYETRKARMGLQGDLMDQLRLQDDVYLVAWPGLASLIERVYEQRTGDDIEVETVSDLPNGAQVLALR